MTSPEVVVVTLLNALRGTIVCCCGSVLRVAGDPEDVARAHARTFFMAHADCGSAPEVEVEERTPARQPFGADPQQAAHPAAQAGDGGDLCTRCGGPIDHGEPHTYCDACGEGDRGFSADERAIASAWRAGLAGATS